MRLKIKSVWAGERECTYFGDLRETILTGFESVFVGRRMKENECSRSLVYRIRNIRGRKKWIMAFIDKKWINTT
jgi:hypothetical protein